MAFGFVVAKFGLVLDELPGHHHNLGSHFADIVGTLLVASGAVFLVLSTIEFLSVGRAIKSGNLRARPLLFMALSGLLVIVAVVLAIYLLLTS